MTRDELDAKILSLVERCKEHGWDGYHARPIGLSAALRAQELLKGVELPDEIVPDVDGGFGIYWYPTEHPILPKLWISIDGEGQCISLKSVPASGVLDAYDFEVVDGPVLITRALAHLRAGRPAREFTP